MKFLKKIFFPFVTDKHNLADKRRHRMFVVIFRTLLIMTFFGTYFRLNMREAYQYHEFKGVQQVQNMSGDEQKRAGEKERGYRFNSPNNSESLKSENIPQMLLENAGIGVLKVLIHSYVLQFLYFVVLMYIIYGKEKNIKSATKVTRKKAE